MDNHPHIVAGIISIAIVIIAYIIGRIHGEESADRNRIDTEESS